MIEIQSLMSIFNGALAWAKAYGDESNRHDEQYENALLAVYAATTETKNYISTLNETRDKEKERKLSELWYKAGIRLRKFNHDLAERCVIKADYWADPTKWSSPQIEEARITLENIIKETQKLI